jgi:predicted acylesterase/phospholipase RssA
MTESERQRIHLLLSAGGVRCLSYIGALEQLERSGYEVATVSTCSAGTLVGALYCCGMSPGSMREAALELDLHRLAGDSRGRWIRGLRALLWPPSPLYPDPGIPRVFSQLLEDQRLDSDPTLGDLRIPLSTAAVDVAQQRLLVYSTAANPKMRLAELLSIATAVPVYYRPHYREGREIFDASLASYTPVWLATGQREDLPVAVLRTRGARTEDRRRLPGWLNAVASAAVLSRDTFLLERMPKVSVYEIGTEVSAFDFTLSRTQVEQLIDAGRSAVAEAEERREEGAIPPLTYADDDAAEDTATSRYETHLDRMARSRTATVFLSYAREDRSWVMSLREKLGSLIADPDVSVWDDSYVKPGRLWNAAIVDAISRARVAVLFVSRSFLDSSYIEQRELPLLRRQLPGRVLWISIDGAQPPGPERELQAVGGAAPLDRMSEPDADLVLSELAREIDKIYHGTV